MFPLYKLIFHLPATNFQTVSAGLFRCSVVLIVLVDSCSDSSAAKNATVPSDSRSVTYLFHSVFVESGGDRISTFAFKEQMRRFVPKLDNHHVKSFIDSFFAYFQLTIQKLHHVLHI